ncbi:MAG: SRPBCC family protein [Acidimicrobiia bacterium]|nr:SRPBCC family protein [Acidimicrobiia bacterium]
MRTETAEIDIAATPDAVWAVAGDFGGIQWMPGIESVTVDGDDRTINTSGMTIVERLVKRDDDEMTISYSIVDGPVPVESHEATISVVPAGDGSHVSYSVTTEPDDAAGFMKDVYAGALQALKAKIEG